MNVTQPPILAFAPNDWDGPWMNRQHLLTRLAARGWPVIYSTGPLDLWERTFGEWTTARLTHRVERRDGVWIDRPGRLFPIWQTWPTWKNMALRVHARHLARAARRISASKPIAYIFHPAYADYAACLDAEMVVYHAYDDYSQAGDWTPSLERAEKELVTRSALVVASSFGIADRIQQRHGVRPTVLLNGADADAFVAGAAQDCPADLQTIARPRIGYVGRITRKVDLALIAALAEERRDWSFVLVGPVILNGAADAAEKRHLHDALARCQSQPNVHFLGEKPPSDIARYTGHMDVNLMCYRADAGWWSVIYPLKLHEYLASGKPLVSTNIDGAVQHADVVEIARHPREWVPKIAQSLRSDGPKERHRRQKIARRNTWDKRVDQLEAYLHKALARDDHERAVALHHTFEPMPHGLDGPESTLDAAYPAHLPGTGQPAAPRATPPLAP